VSEDLVDTNPMGHPSGLQIACITVEAVRLIIGEAARLVVLIDLE
jgi:hypothetical protein